MNPKDIIAQISEKTGIGSDICDKIMSAVKDSSGDSTNSLGAVGALLGKVTGGKGGKSDSTSLVAMLDPIVKKTGLPKDVCEKVLKAAEEIIGKGGKDILSKLNLFK